MIHLSIRWGWGVPAFICGNLAAVGIGSAFSPNGSGNLRAGIVCAMLTFFCVRKSSSGRLLPEGRTYTPGDPLPTSVCPGLLLTRGEVGHLCETVKIGKVKNVSTGTVTTRSGGSVRVARGLSVHSGTSHSNTMRADVLDTSPGTLYVTNKRVVGSSSKYSFDEKISSLTSVKMYSDGFAFQFGGKNYTILVRDPIYVATILQIANRLSVY